jgi:hypothetical protein
VPVPKDEKISPVNAPSALPYEFQFAQHPTTQTAQTPQMITPQYMAQSQSQKSDEKEMRSIMKKVIIGTLLLMIPLINLIGIGLLISAARQYWKLKHR